jgi:hypothetical protein
MFLILFCVAAVSCLLCLFCYSYTGNLPAMLLYSFLFGFVSSIAFDSGEILYRAIWGALLIITVVYGSYLRWSKPRNNCELENFSQE